MSEQEMAIPRCWRLPQHITKFASAFVLLEFAECRLLGAGCWMLNPTVSIQLSAHSIQLRLPRYFHGRRCARSHTVLVQHLVECRHPLSDDRVQSLDHAGELLPSPLQPPELIGGRARGRCLDRERSPRATTGSSEISLNPAEFGAKLPPLLLDIVGRVTVSEHLLRFAELLLDPPNGPARRCYRVRTP